MYWFDCGLWCRKQTLQAALYSLTWPTQGANVVPIEHKMSDGNDPTAAEHDLHVEDWMDRSLESEYIVEFSFFCCSKAHYYMYCWNIHSSGRVGQSWINWSTFSNARAQDKRTQESPRDACLPLGSKSFNMHAVSGKKVPNNRFGTPSWR